MSPISADRLHEAQRNIDARLGEGNNHVKDDLEFLGVDYDALMAVAKSYTEFVAVTDPQRNPLVAACTAFIIGAHVMAEAVGEEIR